MGKKRKERRISHISMLDVTHMHNNNKGIILLRSIFIIKGLVVGL